MLEAAHALRLQHERKKSLANQKQEQQASLNHTEQRVQRLQQQLKEMQQAAMGATPKGYFSWLMLCMNTVYVFIYCFEW
jgi:intraflagellar transport protein 81